MIISAVRHYNFLPPFFTAVYIVEGLVLQSTLVLNKKILPFLSLKYAVYNDKSSAVLNQERVIMAQVQ